MYPNFQPSPIHRGMIRGWKNLITGAEHVAFDPSKVTDEANFAACLTEMQGQLFALDGGNPRSDRTIDDYIRQYQVEGLPE